MGYYVNNLTLSYIYLWKSLQTEPYASLQSVEAYPFPPHVEACPFPLLLPDICSGFESIGETDERWDYLSSHVRNTAANEYLGFRLWHFNTAILLTDNF